MAEPDRLEDVHRQLSVDFFWPLLLLLCNKLLASRKAFLLRFDAPALRHTALPHSERLVLQFSQEEGTECETGQLLVIVSPLRLSSLASLFCFDMCSRVLVLGRVLPLGKLDHVA
jgi:hypothetical protein